MKQSTSPPTFAAFACLSVMIPLEVETIAVPSPPSTLGMFAAPAYVRSPGLETRLSPAMTGAPFAPYFSPITSLPE